MAFWTKETGAGGWDCKGKAGRSQVDDKEQILVNKFFWASQKQGDAGSPKDSSVCLSATLGFYYRK